ncbi:uncharacterized protein LOC144926936 isoform X2 [Branchiostoma floridae x Branchiostoma belcheri]
MDGSMIIIMQILVALLALLMGLLMVSLQYSRLKHRPTSMHRDARGRGLEQRRVEHRENHANVLGDRNVVIQLHDNATATVTIPETELETPDDELLLRRTHRKEKRSQDGTEEVDEVIYEFFNNSEGRRLANTALSFTYEGAMVESSELGSVWVLISVPNIQTANLLQKDATNGKLERTIIQILRQSGKPILVNGNLKVTIIEVNIRPLSRSKKHEFAATSSQMVTAVSKVSTTKSGGILAESWRTTMAGIGQLKKGLLYMMSASGDGPVVKDSQSDRVMVEVRFTTDVCPEDTGIASLRHCPDKGPNFAQPSSGSTECHNMPPAWQSGPDPGRSHRPSLDPPDQTHNNQTKPGHEPSSTTKEQQRGDNSAPAKSQAITVKTAYTAHVSTLGHVRYKSMGYAGQDLRVDRTVVRYTLFLETLIEEGKWDQFEQVTAMALKKIRDPGGKALVLLEITVAHKLKDQLEIATRYMEEVASLMSTTQTPPHVLLVYLYLKSALARQRSEHMEATESVFFAKQRIATVKPGRYTGSVNYHAAVFLLKNNGEEMDEHIFLEAKQNLVLAIDHYERGISDEMYGASCLKKQQRAFIRLALLLLNWKGPRGVPTQENLTAARSCLDLVEHRLLYFASNRLRCYFYLAKSDLYYREEDIPGAIACAEISLDISRQSNYPPEVGLAKERLCFLRSLGLAFSPV